MCSLSLTSQEKQNLRDRNAEVSRIKLQSFKCTAVMSVLCIQRQTKPLIISEAVFSHILSLVATIVYFSCVQISNRLRSKQLPFETVRNHWEVLRRNQSCAGWHPSLHVAWAHEVIEHSTASHELRMYGTRWAQMQLQRKQCKELRIILTIYRWYDLKWFWNFNFLKFQFAGGTSGMTFTWTCGPLGAYALSLDLS